MKLFNTRCLLSILKSCWPALVGSVILLIFIGEGIWFNVINSQTADEASHLVTGYSYWIHGNKCLNPDYPPFLRALAALPIHLCYQISMDPVPIAERDDIWRIGRDFLYKDPSNSHQILQIARIPNLIIGTMLIGLIGWWSYRLWGKIAGLLSMSLAGLDPNLIAHSNLVTTDIGTTFFLLLSIYLLWEYTLRPECWRLLLLGISTGVALECKHMSILLLAIEVILLFGMAIGSSHGLTLWAQGLDRKDSTLYRLLIAFATVLIIAGMATIVIEGIHDIYGVRGWWQGFQAVRKANTQGYSSFFLGEYSRTGWWSYFLVAFCIKTPLGTLILIALALLSIASDKLIFSRRVIFLLLPVLIWGTAASMGSINVGLRHILPIYPFLFVLAGKLAITYPFRCRWLTFAVIGMTLITTAISSTRVAPHQLAYFNELVGGPDAGRRFLSDSNIDWGQDLKGLKNYLEQEEVAMIYLAYYDTAPPAAYGIRYQHLPSFGPLGPIPSDQLAMTINRELLAISVMNLQGVHFYDKNVYRWLDHRQPITKIGYSIFVYDITGDLDAHIELMRLYFKMKQFDLAKLEIQKVFVFDKTNSEALFYHNLLPK